jgi:DNA end-binding protein Ku
MKALSSTAISFGLVNVPVKVYKAVDSHDVSFKLHHAECGGSIGMVRFCKGCEAQDVAWADLSKGIEYDGLPVIVSPDEIKALEGEKPPAIEVVQFIDAGEIDPLSYESPYYLAPDKVSLEGYSLIRDVLAEQGRVALVRFALRSRVSMGILRPVGKLLVLQSLAWEDEVREPAFPILDKPVAVRPKLMEMARVLVDSMTGEYEPSEWVDVYTARVKEFVAAKAGDGEFVPAAPAVEEGVDDLIAALEASLAKKKKAKAKKPAA